MELLGEEDSEKLSKQIVIKYLRRRVQTDTGEFNKCELYYLSTAKSFFKNAISGLNSVLYDTTRYNWINENASWFYEALTNQKIIRGNSQKKEIQKVIQEIKKSKRKLEHLVKNTAQSYTDGTSKQLAIFIDKLWNVIPDDDNL